MARFMSASLSSPPRALHWERLARATFTPLEGTGGFSAGEADDLKAGIALVAISTGWRQSQPFVATAGKDSHRQCIADEGVGFRARGGEWTRNPYSAGKHRAGRGGTTGEAQGRCAAIADGPERQEHSQNHRQSCQHRATGEGGAGGIAGTLAAPLPVQGLRTPPRL